MSALSLQAPIQQWGSVPRLSRSARLVRTSLVLSIAVVMAAVAAAGSGAGEQIVKSNSYITVVVPTGATLWSIATAYGDGEITAEIEAIREANNLQGYDISVGTRLRIPNL